MAKRIDQVLYFTVDFDVEWTNNSCEQAIRMAKLQAKISGSWRSMRGLKAFRRIRSYIATARAHDVPVFTALRDAFLDSPWSIPATPRDRIGQPTRSRTPLNGYPRAPIPHRPHCSSAALFIGRARAAGQSAAADALAAALPSLRRLPGMHIATLSPPDARLRMLTSEVSGQLRRLGGRPGAAALPAALS
jgi:hypothetical protein